MRTTRVLFLCARNTARSQMAEGLLRARAGDRCEVYSAGNEPSGVHPLAIEAMLEIGVDISGQRSKSTREVLGQRFGYVITLCNRAREKCLIFPGAVQRLEWPLDDPAAAVGNEADRLAVFRRIRDQIETRVLAFINDAAL
jgi:arsenate reductase